MTNYELWQLEKYGNIIPVNSILPPDDRTDAEVQQQDFEKKEQQYEYDMQHPE